MTPTRLAPLLLLCLPFSALAQEDGGRGASADRQRSPWGVGVAAVVSDSPYAGEGTRVIPVPLLSYEGDRFYLRGITAGWRLVDADGFEVSVLGKARLDGFDVDDLDRATLAGNGLDAALLEDRDKGLDLGLGMAWSGAAGELQLELLADASGRSDGQEVSLQYGYPIRAGRAVLTPMVGATWWSADMAGYYYGPLRAEVARGVPDYAPGAVTVPHAGVSFFRPLGRTWSLVGSLRYSHLPSAIGNSPFVEPGTDGTLSMFVGVSRGFRPWWMKGATATR
jgi:outer membrane protein